MNLVEKYNLFPSEEQTFTLEENIVFSIMDDLNGRRGMGFHTIDDDILEDVIKSMIKITSDKIGI